MLDFEKIRKEMESKISTAIQSIPVPLPQSIPIQYENVSESHSLLQAKNRKEPWIRIVIREGDGFSASLGENVLRRFPGNVLVSLFYPLNEGTRTLREIGSFIANYIVRQHISYVYIFTPSFALIGETEDWFQANLTIPFHFDQLTN